MASAAASTSTSTSSAGLDTARILVQKIARTFYNSRAAILVDQLVQRECFRDEELARRLGMQIKDISKIAHRLVEDQIVQVHRRSEMRDNGMVKAQLRAYYYLDYSKATDVIKWRMWRIQQTIDVKLRNELDAQGYVCPLCKASYTPLDAASLYDPMSNMFLCSVCQTEVINNENEEEVKGNKDRMQRLNRQTKGIVDLLKKMDRVELPRFNVEAYLAIHGPALGATAQAAAEAAGTAPAQQAVVTVHIAGDDDEANELRRREAEVQAKRAQNALPSWIAQSTIASAPGAPDDPDLVEPSGVAQARGTTDGAGPVAFSSAAAAGGATLRMGDHEAKPALVAPGAASDPAETGDADLDAYYASLERATPVAAAAAGAEASSALVLDALERSPLLDSPGVSSGRAGTEDQFDEADGVASGPTGKRDREGDELNPDEASAGAAKRARLDHDAGVGANPFPAAALGSADGMAAAAEEEEEEAFDDEFDDEFEPAEGGADPNQLISVNGKMLPFSDVTEDMTGDMTADEYSAYWEVYQQVNA
ncbi:hypothetical protein JCM3770_000421 [Rhodotorula araucariae]